MGISDLLIWFVMMPIVLPGIVVIVIYLAKGVKMKKVDDVDIFKRSLKLNSKSIIPWVKEYIKKDYVDDIECNHNEYLAIGKENKITPIIYIQGYGNTSYKIYHILVNLIEPETKNSVITGKIERETIIKMAEALSYAPPKTNTEIIKVHMPDGSTREITRNSYEPDVPIPIESKQDTGGNKK